MVDDQDIQDFLEHYGVKGQKWGVRKERAIAVGQAVGRGSVVAGKAIGRGSVIAGKAVGRGSVKAAKFVNEHKKETAIALAVGGTIVAGIMLRNKNLRITNMRVQNAERATSIFNAHRNVQISALNRAHSEGRVSREQGHRIAALVERNLENRLSSIAQPRRVNYRELLGLGRAPTRPQRSRNQS